jgi:segregation and condensation protein B
MKTITDQKLKELIEAAIFVAQTPLSKKMMQQTLFADYKMTKQRIIAVLEQLNEDYSMRGIELVEVASGYRFQARASLSDDLAVLFKEKAPRYSRALLETLALIAYKQPITRGEIEDIRGVAVASNITKTLLERHWIKIVGHKEVPGRPALYATTAQFLDYFSLNSLTQLPQIMPVPERAAGQ